MSLVRTEYDPDYKPANPGYNFPGFAGTQEDYMRIFRTFRAWHMFGIMAVAGGYYDQPTWWEHDIRVGEAIFNTLVNMVVTEVKARPPKPSR